MLTAELQGKINTKTLLVNTLTHIAICASNDARQIRFLVASVACGKTAKPDCLLQRGMGSWLRFLEAGGGFRISPLAQNTAT